MKNTFLLIVVLSSLIAVSQVHANDIAVVKSILVKNSINTIVEEIAIIEQGRIVELNLNNKNAAKEGMTILPPEIGELTELRVLTINDNDLKQLPKEIYDCTKLTRLEVQSNDLSSLPSGIEKLIHLRELSLRNNELIELPGGIGKLKSIVILQLWGNGLVLLPQDIGQLSSLKELYLKGNKLTRLPLSITNLKLTYLDVADNHIRSEQGKVDIWIKKYDKEYRSTQIPL